jgi:hypothetical protein
VEVLGLDHIYLTVSDVDRAERFYDQVMQLLGFRKGDKRVAGERHAHYFNPSLQITIRPARSGSSHDPYAQVSTITLAPTRRDVDAAARLSDSTVSPPDPKLYQCSPTTRRSSKILMAFVSGSSIARRSGRYRSIGMHSPSLNLLAEPLPQERLSSNVHEPVAECAGHPRRRGGSPAILMLSRASGSFLRAPLKRSVRSSLRTTRFSSSRNGRATWLAGVT